MLSTTNLTIQFEAKPLFEQVTVKFADGSAPTAAANPR
jgi:hypothetical protein